ncbi:uncharacterized protein LOC120349713 [Nilaparvata lugens]|uniref:uncharacterized protein LOC120349713 n=1 Tax=Nilaparvata lugens TaxID=108931 RepID=UPI00193CAB60|nr:uncharacterized protein LOC120349713 [Nilaparvata lugens]
MSLAAHLLPWGVDFSTSWIALLVINNVTSPMQDDGWNSPHQEKKYCAGAFVGGSWFLTSASCLQPLPEPHQVTVMTGWGDFKCSQHQLWEFQSIGFEIDLHPGNSDSSFVDLAMVRTRRTVFHVPEVELNTFPHILTDSGCRLLSFEGKHPQAEDEYIKAGFVSVNPTVKSQI